MGQIFNRIKLIAKSYWNSTKKTIRESNLLKEDDNPEEINLDEELRKLKDEIRWKKPLVDPELVKLIPSYKVLGLKLGDGLELVAAKLKELIIKNHPDRFPDPKDKKRASDIIGEITKEYNKIKDYWKNKGSS